MRRSSGVLMHISSLPSKYGIGTMGDEARRFVDFLVKAKQTYWQILPLNQTSYGDSPYQSFSAFAGNPYFIDLDYLCNDGLLKKSDYCHIDWKSKNDSINYGQMYKKRYKVLEIAVNNFIEQGKFKGFNKFVENNEDWLYEYALFMAIKNYHHDVGLDKWKKNYRIKDSKTISNFELHNAKRILFWEVVQYLFYKQWTDLKKYANNKGIKIIGDCPIYVASDSCDVWSNPKLFVVDKNLKPIKVAGCPPDGFSKTGQLWGNPLYDWKAHKKQKYQWWIARVNHLTKIYDYVRIDHFRGIASYYTIPGKAKTAINGKWVVGPGKDLIRQIKKHTNNKIIAEDLGFMTDDVKQLLKYSNYPGMNVLEFGFDPRDTSNNDNLPENVRKHSIVYAGTHDNETIMGWIHSIPKEQYEFAKAYMKIKDKRNFSWGMLDCLWKTRANVVIAQAQDLLSLDNKARMNKPSTLGCNWKWRAKKNVFDDKLARKLAHMTIACKRA